MEEEEEELPQNEASHTNCGWHVASGTVPVGCKLTVRPGHPYWECLVFYDQLVAKVSSQKDSKSDIIDETLFGPWCKSEGK